MSETAIPETGPVDAPASVESIAAEIAAGGEGAPNTLEEVTQELVEEAGGSGEPEQSEPEAEEATEPAEDEAENPEEDSPEEQTDEPKYTVKVNGEEREVPLSELLKGYSRTEDYKQKTAAVAEARREAEALKANVEAQTKAEYANQLEEATNLFAQFDPVLAEAQKIDWAALKEADPAAFLAAQDAVNERLTAIGQMKQQVEKLRGESQQHSEAQLQRARAERFDKAAEKIVAERQDLADPAKFEAFATDNVKALQNEYGFTSEEIVDVLDDRVLRLVDDARQWRAHKAAQKSLPAKKVVPRSAVKPLTSDGSGSSQPRARFPGNAPRETKLDWVSRQILNSE